MEKGLSKMAEAEVIRPDFKKNSTKHIAPNHPTPPIAAQLSLPEECKISAAQGILEHAHLLMQSNDIPSQLYYKILDSKIGDIANGYESPPAA